MGWLDFYMSLPQVSTVRDFYVKGYTEATKYYSGVRVIPEASYLSELHSAEAQDMVRYIHRVGFPCYLFPVVDKTHCYGFVFKGREKYTPVWRANKTPYVLGMNKVGVGDVVYLCEGIKDSYVLLASGVKAVPMLTAVPNQRFLSLLKERQNWVVFVSDNDAYRNNNQQRFCEKAQFLQIPYVCGNINGVKDLGEFFDGEQARGVVLENVKEVFKYVKSVFGRYK